MSVGNEKTKPFQIQGLWPHEVAAIGLLAAALYCSQFHTHDWPVFVYRAAFLAALPVLWYRCREEWQQLPNRGFFLGLTVVWFALFEFLGMSTYGQLGTSSLLTWMFNVYSSPAVDEQHGMLIPFVVMILVWWKRKELAAQPARGWPPGLWLVAAGLALHFLGYILQQPRLSVIGMLTGFFGVMGLAWGPKFLKALRFPYFLLIFCVPLGELGVPITLPLRIMVATIVATISQLGLAPDVMRQGTQLFDAQHTFAYDVAPACSGIHSLVAMLALTIIYGFVSFKAPWKRLLMVAAAMPLAVLGNVVRLCFTIMVAEMFGQTAGKAVETNAGFITFAVAIGCVILLGRWLEKSEIPTELESAPVTPVNPGRENRPLLPVLVIFLVLMGTTAAVIKHAGANRRLGEPGVRTEPLAGSRNLQVVLPTQVPGYSGRLTNQSDVVVNALPTDTSFGTAIYTGKDGFHSVLNVVLMGTDRTSIHKPQVCLTGQGWVIDDAASKVETLTMTRPFAYDLPVMRLVATLKVEVDGQPRVLRGVYVYWFVDGTKYTAEHWQRMWWMARDMVTTGVLDRFAYISYFSECLPGQEDATFDRMKQLMADSVPEFQLVPQDKAAITAAAR